MDRGRSRQSRSRSRSRDRSRSRGRDRSRDRPTNARLADKRVYISNIPYDSRWQDIKDLFRKDVGEVAFVELFSDENDKPRGCGIIEFESPLSAKKAIEKMHRFEMAGRKIVVKEDYDVERDKQGRIVTGSNRNTGGGGGGGGGGGNAGRDRDRDRSRDRDRDLRDWDRRDQSPSPQVNQGGKFGNTYGLSQSFLESLGIDGSLIPKVFVSNLDFRVDEKKLKEVFRLAGRVLSVDVNKDKEGKSRGHGVIEYEHPVEAVQAISMFNNQQLFERRMHVKMDRLSDPIADLAKNRLPDGLRTIGMGLGTNGQPLVDVARTIIQTTNNTNALANTSLLGSVGAFGNASLAGNPLAALSATGLNLSQMSSLLNQQAALDLGVSLPNTAQAQAAAQAAAANVFNMAAGIGQLNPSHAGLTAAAGQLGLTGSGLSGLSALGVNMGGSGGVGGMQSNPNVNALMGSSGTSVGGGSVGSGIGGMGSGNAQPSPFQNTGGGNQGGSGSGSTFGRDDFGYTSSIFNLPNQQFGSNAFGGDIKPQYGNGTHTGGGSGGGGGQGSQQLNRSNVTNTVIVSNLPASCTWQTLKTKFRECGEVVFAEKRDNNTGIVRFATERDAERAVKVFDQSRVDGRLVEVRFL